MYKLVLCWRYLRTRWIALASIVSVMLGVATLIVVNSVMGGFASEMKDRMQGVLSDLVVERFGVRGFELSEDLVARMELEAGDKIAAWTPVVECLALVAFEFPDRRLEPVQVFGVYPEGREAVGQFVEHLHDRKVASFDIDKTVDTQAAPIEVTPAGSILDRKDPNPDVLLGPPTMTTPVADAMPALPPDSSLDPPAAENELGLPPDPFSAQGALVEFEDTSAQATRGIVFPWLLASYRARGKDYEFVRPGDEVTLLALSNSGRLEPKAQRFVVVNRFESGMSEYDQRFCYLHIEDLQALLGMENKITSIQIRLHDYRDAPEVVEKLRKVFPLPFSVSTWEQKQGALMAAVSMEIRLLNLLLFLIIAVAGFGILAIFFMIVVEKTRDIGVLKALGASDRGVQGIFLSYGCMLGAVGSMLGMAMGLLIVVYLDEIEAVMSKLTGREVFPRDLYYFDSIPAIIDPFSVAWVVFGAMLIAVLASVLPARRAAALHPVHALRLDT